MVTVSYLWHDGFIVSLPRVTLLFDYWCDPSSEPGLIPPSLRQLSKDKPLYVFISHGHKDHFNPEVFSWAAEFPDVRYVVSKDVAARSRHRFNPLSSYKGAKVRPEMVAAVKEGDRLALPEAAVRVYGSTDLGNSYLVEAGGLRIFHAGDLNAWILGKASETENSRALLEFEDRLQAILAGEVEAGNQGEPLIDLLFFPIDPTIGEGYIVGLSRFVAKLRTRRFFPMHLCGDGEGLTEEKLFKLDAAVKMLDEEEVGEVIVLGAPGDRFSFRE